MAEGFSDAASTDASRSAFARSAVELLREHALDGIDLDWEYPGQGIAGIKFRHEDKQNFTLLLKSVRQQLDRQKDARLRGRRRPLPANDRHRQIASALITPRWTSSTSISIGSTS